MKKILSKYKLLFLAIFLMSLGCIQEDNEILENLNKSENPLTSDLSSSTFPPSCVGTNGVRVMGFLESDITDAINLIEASNGGKLFFPAGDYVLSNVGSTNKTVLNFNGGSGLFVNGLEIAGEEGTVIRLNSDTSTRSGMRLLNVSDVSCLYIHDIRFEGTFEGFGIFADADLRNQKNINLSNCTNVLIEDVESTNIDGNGLNIGTFQEGDKSNNIVVRRFFADVLNRAGIVFLGKGETDNVTIEYCNFGGNFRTQQIDFEPDIASFGKISNVTIQNNIFNTAVPHDTPSQQAGIATYARNAIITGININNNNFNGNAITLQRGTSASSINNNTDIGVLAITNITENIEIRDNNFILGPTPRTIHLSLGAGLVISDSRNAFEGEPNNIRIHHNFLEVDDSFDLGVYVTNAKDVDINNNTVSFGSQNSNGEHTGMRFKVNSPLETDLEIYRSLACDNTFINVDPGFEYDTIGTILLPCD